MKRIRGKGGLGELEIRKDGENERKRRVKRIRGKGG